MVKRPSCRTPKGTPYGNGVGIHVDEAGTAEAEGFELLGGAPFYGQRGLVAGPTRAPHMGWEFIWMRQAQRRTNMFY